MQTVQFLARCLRQGTPHDPCPPSRSPDGDGGRPAAGSLPEP